MANRTVFSGQTEPSADELKLIPRWSIAAAAVAFLAMQYIFWAVLPVHHHHQPSPIGLRIYFAMSLSLLSSLYMLMIGYISRDTARRGMSAWQWIVICLVLPTGIGAVLYFLLRQPLLTACPACSTLVQNAYHFCPQCAWQVSASCGRCYRSVRTTDLYCVHCGHDLAEDNAPARLQTFRS